MAYKDSSTSWFVYGVKLLMFSCYCLQFCFSALDTISPVEPITVSKSISSANNNFELGFFLPENSVNYYVGIWYKNINDYSTSSRTVVWVANRDHPFTGSSMALVISSDGNLVIMDGKVHYKVTNISSDRTSNTRAVLLDSGNLVLRDVKSNTSLWQSFDFPTDTILPGMKIGYDISTGKSWSLLSLNSNNDPSPGVFSFMTDPKGTPQLLIRKGSEVRWTSGTWNGENFSLVPEMRFDHMYKITYVSNQKMSYFAFDTNGTFNITARLVISVTGQIQLIVWLEQAKMWNYIWSEPRAARCEASCGPFAACQVRSEQYYCSCLTGFEPRFPYNWGIAFYSEGCKRKTNLHCSSTSNGSQDKFIMISKLVLLANPVTVPATGFRECESECLNNCSCSAFAYDNECKLWEGDLLEMQQLTYDDPSGKDLHVKLASSEGNKRKLWIITTSTVSITVLALFMLICWTWKRKHGRKAGEDLLSFDFSTTPGAVKYELTDEDIKPGKSKSQVKQLPQFSFSSIAAATNNFSSSNTLGEGGFGPVYKGKLQSGYEVAVKRLSRRSGQGLEELRNETILIAKLQHKNLVKILGCCIEGDEKILIYEYLSNKSLDVFLFDPMKNRKLDWETRIGIIEGIAQGLLYLHQFSRLQIIHRDLKASNILLDEHMNPKISDFGMARIFGGSESQTTNRIVGTYGYMSPEYALEGIFSVKSDVFSFGVLLLEILSGKKNTEFHQTSSLNLLGYAWDLWRSEKPRELMDPILGDSCFDNVALKYITIGLLCVQEKASLRPTVADVVSMLSNEDVALPSPKQPAYSHLRTKMAVSSSDFRPEINSINGVTLSVVEAR